MFADEYLLLELSKNSNSSQLFVIFLRISLESRDLIKFLRKIHYFQQKYYSIESRVIYNAFTNMKDNFILFFIFVR